MPAMWVDKEMKEFLDFIAYLIGWTILVCGGSILIGWLPFYTCCLIYKYCIQVIDFIDVMDELNKRGQLRWPKIRRERNL